MIETPKLLAMQEILTPDPALVEALNPDFLGKLLIENFPPVRLANLPDLGGFCPRDETSELGEIVISTGKNSSSMEWYREVYIHEITHKFINQYEEIGGSHGPVFFCLQLVLFLRAGDKKNGNPWIFQADFYDFQNSLVADDFSPGQALDWAWNLANRLEDTEISAEKCAEIIVQKFKIWHQKMIDLPAKRLESKEKNQDLISGLKEKLSFWRKLAITTLSIYLILFIFFVSYMG